MVVERIALFLEAPESDRFEDLALEAFAFQHRRIPAYRRLCAARGATPESVARWQEIPAVPALAFKSLTLAAAPAREVFRSSGTTRGLPSVHHHPYPDLYRRVIDATFPAACLAGLDRPAMLSLIPSRRTLPDSSLSFLADHVLERFGGPGSETVLGRDGIELERARRWLAAGAAAGEPVVVLATALALADLLDRLAAGGGRFALPPGSVLFETGGFKGRRRKLDRATLLATVEERLGLPRSRVVREYGMTELTSHFYTAALAGGDPDRFLPPPWTRVRILDPLSLEESPEGETGLIAVLDLANVGSALHLLTEDLGVAEPPGFRLVGRAAGAELRGCSLAAEALAAP